MMQLPRDFKEFLLLLNKHKVEYLIIGGYAVGYYGYPRATGDIDIFIAVHPANAQKLVTVLIEFGFVLPELSEDIFLVEGKIIRMGNPPVRIELITSISGVTFSESYLTREVVIIDDIEVNLISLNHLKINKQAAGRYKDLNDLENL